LTINTIVESFPMNWRNHYNAILNNLAKFEDRKYFNRSDYFGKSVLDFGGSGGQMAVALLSLGAKNATIVDPEISDEVAKKLAAIPGLLIVKGYVETAVKQIEGHFDFIVAHSVTEHIQNLPEALDSLLLLLRSGGKFFIAHDNYYHASGHHDNMILQVGPDGKYGYQGPKCWEQGLCSISFDFRRNTSELPSETWFPYIWSEEDEATLSDGNCSNCNFRKRTTPWAHLLHQDSFNEIYRVPAFSTGRPNSTLNKVTPFQLKQFLIEAGFRILLWERSFINNEVPEQLLESLEFFSETDLKTENVFVVATRI